MWRRRRHVSRISGASRITPRNDDEEGVLMTEPRLHLSRQRIAPLSAVAAIFFLVTTLNNRESTSAISPPSPTGLDVATIDQSQHQQNKAAKLRFDWTNMTLHSELAIQFHAHQNNCSIPLAHDGQLNPYGLGSSLHSWHRRICGDIGSGYRTWTTINKEQPWIWLDESKCNTSATSPLSCYFPTLELQCSNDANPKAAKPVDSYKKCVQHVLGGNGTQEQWARLHAAGTEYMFHSVSPIVIQEAERQLQLIFPGGIVPSNLITVHVRWGDKILAEMKKVPIHEYVEGVKTILNMRNASKDVVNIFLATEDPHAVEEFKQAAPSDWNVYVDQYFHDMKKHRPDKARGQNNNDNAIQTSGRAGLVALGSLLVSMEANDFVLTTASNWSRLMNELRKNVLNPRCNGCTNLVDLRVGKDV